MEFQPFGRTADGKRIDDVSGVSMRVYIDCLEEIFTHKKSREAAKHAVEELVRLLNERISDPTYHVTPAFLKTIWNSYSHEFSLYLTTFCSILAEDPDFHLRVGQKTIHPLIQALGRPFSVQQIFKMCAHFGGKYVKAIRFDPIQVERNHAIIRITFSENSLRQFGQYRKACVAEICATIKSACSTIPEAVHDLLPARVNDRTCVANGDPYCEWDITWNSEQSGSLRWWAAEGSVMLLTFLGLRIFDPLAPFIESLILSLVPTFVLWELHSRFILRRELRRRGEIIDEQALTTDARHEELREAYLEQEQRTADLRRKVSELTMLHKTGLLLTSTHDIEELISSALGTLIEGLHFDHVLLSFYDPSTSVLKNTLTLGVGEDVAHRVHGFEATVQDADSIEGTVVLRERPVLVNDVKESWPRMQAMTKDIITLLDIKNFIAVPLKGKDRILGMIVVDRVGEGSLAESDLEVMITFSNELAIGVDNARASREIEELNIGLESKVRQRTVELEAANTRLKELDQLKSQFIAHVSHELRTPLTSIQGFADNMLDGISGVLTEKQQHNLTRITANAGRLQRMISNLLDQSQIEAGKIQLSYGDVSIRQLTQDVIEHMQPLAQAKHQCVELMCSEPDLMIWGDPDKLRQIVTNLTDNAIKYSPPQGRIRITIRREGKGLAKLSVTDSGKGIPRNALSKIFERFYRVDGSQQRDVKGFGLGLSIVKTLIELHGGQVMIDSEEGKGSSFHVTLPVSQQVFTKSGELSGNVRRILIVDDDPDIRQFLIDRLEGIGYVVKAATTGREAIARIASETFDGAILDIGLPELNGIEVLRHVRSGNRNMPILIITAAESRDRAMQALESGAQTFLLKPFNAVQFERVILQCFGKCAPERDLTS